MKNLTIATMKEALKMMSINDTHEAEMMKAVTIFENGGHFIAKWNGSRVIKAGIAVKSNIRKAGYIAIVEAVIECIGEDRWNEIVEVVESIEEATIEADPIESMTKAEIVEKIESIPSEQLSLAVTSILYRNPFNEISTNRVYVNKCGRHITGIGFQTNATKQNMVTVYKEILDQIAISFGIEEMHKIEAGYTPIWWEDDTNEEAQETKEDIEEINQQIAEEAMEEAQEWIEEAKEKEEQTMKNTKSMTKSEAIREIATLSSSTLARICGSTNYSIIDDCCNRLILAASNMKEDAFCDCENWIDVLDRINVSKDNDVDNHYLLGNMDYREYITKYGEEEAKTILRNYIQTVLDEGIADTKTERDYIRGAKDALCIA